MKKVVISCSGGMDSTALLINMLSKGYEVDVINFNYGQKHILERERLECNINYLKSSNLPVSLKEYDLSSIMGDFESSLTSKDIETPDGHYAEENMKKTVVPNRNAIFASLLYGIALSKAMHFNCVVEIALGVHSGDHAIYPDCRPEFLDALYGAFKMGNWQGEKVMLYCPYLDMDKTSILKDLQFTTKLLGLDFNTILSNTNTCYKPEGRIACGKCGSCTERLEAFAAIGVEDPVAYKGE